MCVSDTFSVLVAESGAIDAAVADRVGGIVVDVPIEEVQ
jgi:hypothetical protein